MNEVLGALSGEDEQVNGSTGQGSSELRRSQKPGRQGKGGETEQEAGLAGPVGPAAQAILASREVTEFWKKMSTVVV